MKKIGLLYALSLAALISCDNVLEKSPLDSFTNDNFWTGEDNVKGYAYGFYSLFTGYGNGNSLGNFYFNTFTDNQSVNGFSDFGPKNIPATNGSWGYGTIRKANIMFENIDKAKMTDASKAHWKGVARLVRAMEHARMVRTFGDIQWVEGVLNVTDNGILYGKREPRDGVMDKVLEDLNYATSNMNDVKTNELNRSTANAIKADICLYEGTYRKYRTNPDLAGADKYLNATKEACQFIMGKSYSLSPTYREIYNSLDLSKNPEMIMYKQYLSGILTHSVIGYITSSTSISGLTRNAVESYLFTDGKPLALTTLNKDDVAKRVIQDRKKGTEMIKDTILKINHMLEVRDKRLAQTIDTALCYVGRDFKGTTASTGYRIIKYDNDELSDNDKLSPNNPTDAPIYWLSVIYLNYAEACAELSDMGKYTITQDDLDKTINKLKARAGLPDLAVNVGFHDPANNMNVSDLIWEIRRERRCELMMDMDARLPDLKRWHQLDKMDTSKYPDIVLGANVKQDTENNQVRKIGDYVYPAMGQDRIFEDRYYLSPIPSNQTTYNPNLNPNNPGWE